MITLFRDNGQELSDRFHERLTKIFSKVRLTWIGWAAIVVGILCLVTFFYSDYIGAKLIKIIHP